MARMIDADALQELCNKRIQDTWNNETAPVLWAAAYADFKDDIDSMPTLTQPPITGDTSDGYHTFNELYHHRAILFSVICNERPEVAWKSKRHHDGTMYDGMFIVGIDTPEGQATYHYDREPYWDVFRVKELELAPEWDGHTPGEAIRRIATLTQPNEGAKDKNGPTNEPLTCEGCIHEHNEHENCNYCKRASYLGDYYYRRPPEREA